MISLKRVHFTYKSTPILKDLSFSAAPGETIALIGTSGSGKTTLLKLISGILKPSQGTIEVPAPLEQAYMSQQDLLLPWRTVIDNITLPFELEGKSFLKEPLDALLEALEIAPYRSRYPHELSGGQLKRVMLARTLASPKKLVLLDEPFDSLDLPLRDKLYTRLKTLTSATLLLVTHDFRDAFVLADRILLLRNGTIQKEWQLETDKKEDPIYMGTLFAELKSELIHSQL